MNDRIKFSSMTVKSTVHAMVLGTGVYASIHGVSGILAWCLILALIGVVWVVLSGLGALVRSSMVRSLSKTAMRAPAEASVTTIIALSMRDELVRAVRPLSSEELADRLDVSESRIRWMLSAMTDRGIVHGTDGRYWLHRNRLGVRSLVMLLAARLGRT